MASPSRLVLGTHNAGKIKELRALLSNLPIELIPASALDEPPEVEENADTLEGNAIKKAQAFCTYAGLPALADDTGLEVAALDGRPGVHTARFAGRDATPEDNKRYLLQSLDDVEDRRARFRTVVALVYPDGTAHTFEGTCSGTITTRPRGEGGFGYDPLFRPEGYEQTFAEMPEEAKNEISHRRKALDALRECLASGGE